MRWWIEPCDRLGGFVPAALVAVILSGVGVALSWWSVLA